MRPAVRSVSVALVALVGGGLAAVGVSSCGAGGGSTVPVAEAQEIQVRMTEFALDPARVRVRAGVIQFFARNEGEEDHVLAVETSDGEIRRTRPIKPGRSASLKLDFRPGRYDMYEPQGDYRAKGMSGRILVAPRTRTVVRTVTRAKTVIRPTTVVVTETRERIVPRTIIRTETVTQPSQP